MAAERIGSAWADIWEAGVWAAGVWEPVDEIGPTPDVSSSSFGRRRTAAFVRKNADFVNRSA
jgi:hypothetical protein